MPQAPRPCVVPEAFIANHKIYCEVLTKLIINARADEAVIALLQNEKLTELILEKSDDRFSVGDIYLGKVKKLASGLNAAFVDVGYDKDAFLHYHDLGPQINSWQSFLRRTQKIKAHRANWPEKNRYSNCNNHIFAYALIKLLPTNQLLAFRFIFHFCYAFWFAKIREINNYTLNEMNFP